MDIQQYIASGIIESYLMGLTNEQETSQVEEFNLQYPEVHKAIESYRLALENYAELHAVNPPAELKSRIWEAIQQDHKTLEENVQADGQIIPMTVETGGKVVPVKRGWRYVAAAAIVLLLVSTYLNVMYLGKYRDVRNRYDQLMISKNDLITQSQVYQSRIEQFEADMHILHDPTMRPVIMEGVKTHPGMMATVYWNAESKTVYLAVNNLPEPPAQMQYQLWAIVDGKPVSAGVFDMEDAGKALQKMDQIGEAQAFAITLEKKGGSVQPTMINMYVMGKV